MSISYLFLFFFNDTATTEIYTLSLHDALPISCPLTRIVTGTVVSPEVARATGGTASNGTATLARSEEHTSELQSRRDLVCRLLLEKKKKNNKTQRQKPYNEVYTVTHTLLRLKL